MKIIAEKKHGQWLIAINGESRTLRESAKLFRVSKDAVVRQLHKGGAKELLAWYKRRELRLKLGLPSRTKVYQKNGETYWVGRVMEITGNTKSTCYRKLVIWEAGDITTSELFAKKMTKKELTAMRTAAAKAAKKKKKPVPLIIQGMQPRKETWELSCAGSCEREMKTADNGMLIERGNTGTNSSGGYYTR